MGEPSGDLDPETVPEPVPVVVAALLAAAEDATRAFAVATGLRCPEGCGACCHDARPEVTELDVSLIARDAVARGVGEALFEAAVAGADARCVFYESEDGAPHKGRCTAYSLRPMLCRLFGFAARRGKTGPELAACRVHRAQTPELVAVAEEAARRGEAPIFGDHQSRLDGLDPARSATKRPINQALARALERELTRLAYAGEEAAAALLDAPPAALNDDAVEGHDPGSEPGRRPPSGKLAA